jgi:hypothetical protein
MAGEAGGKAIAIEKRGGLEETAPKETVYHVNLRNLFTRDFGRTAVYLSAIHPEQG